MYETYLLHFQAARDNLYKVTDQKLERSRGGASLTVARIIARALGVEIHETIPAAKLDVKSSVLIVKSHAFAVQKDDRIPMQTLFNTLKRLAKDN